MHLCPEHAHPELGITARQLQGRQKLPENGEKVWHRGGETANPVGARHESGDVLGDCWLGSEPAGMSRGLLPRPRVSYFIRQTTACQTNIRIAG